MFETVNFDKIRDIIDNLIADGVPEAQIIIRKEGKEVFRHIGGFSDADKTKKASYDDLFWLFSMSKVYTMTATMRLVERGILDLDEPIGTYLKCFNNLEVKTANGVEELKSPLTLRRLMSMTGGYDYNFGNYPEMQRVRENKNATTAEIMEAFSKASLLYQPGETFCYGVGHDIVAGVVEAVSGMTFGEYMKKELFEPLGITDMGFTLTNEQFSRMADKWRVETKDGKRAFTLGAKVNWFKLSDCYESGGAGLFGNASEYIKMVDALANGGIAENGYRVLTEDSINEMRKCQLSKKALEVYQSNDITRQGYGYGLGVRTVLDPKKAGVSTKCAEFGWDGAAGSYVMIDPVNHITVVYVEHILDHGNLHHRELRNAVYECLGL